MCIPEQIAWLILIVVLSIVGYDLYRFNTDFVKSLLRYWPEMRPGFLNMSLVFKVPATVPFKINFWYKTNRLNAIIPITQLMTGSFEVRKKNWVMDYVYLVYQPQLRSNVDLADFNQIFVTNNSIEGNMSWFDDEVRTMLLKFEPFNPKIIIKDQKLYIKARQVGLRDSIGIDEYVDLVATVLKKMQGRL